MKRFLWAAVYGAILLCFTVYCVLDTFVIARVYTPEVTEALTSAASDTDRLTVAAQTESVTEALTEAGTTETEPVETEAPVISENYYSDGNITISITEYDHLGSAVYVADVTLSSPEYLKTALARNAYGRNLTEKTSTIANRAGAILAINGDYYGAQERGFVIRNGVIYRKTAKKDAEALVIYEDGSFEIVNENETTAEALLSAGAYNVFTFGPGLVDDGQICVSLYSEVGRAMSSNPRTAIGMIDDLHYIFVVADGRTDASEGLSLYELAGFMQSLGAKCAYNLDGGGSSTMVFNGKIINKPTTNGRTISERSVSDIVCIGY